MRFEGNPQAEKLGFVAGFLASYAAMTGILYAVLSLGNKLPDAWSFFFVMLITATVIGAGKGIQYILR
ncbi:MAG TPA: hypothetical protein VJB08_04045 [Candidatus Nanoarchaeia archaeon]|nr:hypothetical protein [Candidatus Nanoarchaeia archaeon]